MPIRTKKKLEYWKAWLSGKSVPGDHLPLTTADDPGDFPAMFDPHHV